MFTAAERSKIRERLIDLAMQDKRLVSAALVGGSAREEDRWSDIDLSFGVAAGYEISNVLEDWTRTLLSEFQAINLFDVDYLSTTYRVFLFPGNLQVDLSFAPKADFGSLGADFKLLWGTAISTEPPV